LKKLNDYNELEFKLKFKNSIIYQQLVKDFDVIDWRKNFLEIKKYLVANQDNNITPRQIIGEHKFLPTCFSVSVFYYLEKLLEKNPTQIYDLGCGWNIFKKYITNIVGVGPELDNFHGDIHDLVDDTFILGHNEYYESVFSINALHYHSISKLEKIINNFMSIVKPGGRGFLALNLQRMIDCTTKTEIIEIFSKENPLVVDYEQYVYKILSKIFSNYLIIDVDFSVMDDPINGNIQIVFEK
jgi:hypothetical protein